MRTTSNLTNANTNATTTSTRSIGSRRTRRVIAAVTIAVAFGATSCSGGGGAEPSAAPADAAVVAQAPGEDAPAIAPADQPATAERSAPTGTALVVRSSNDVTLYDSADGTAIDTMPATNSFGSPVALLVLDGQDGWAQVLVPGRPTGRTAWVRTDGVELRQVTSEIRVDLASRTLTLYEDGAQVMQTSVAIGSDDAPTPTGRFSITDKISSTNPDGAYGPYALGLSGRSAVLTDFEGGDGQIAIHGTNDPSSIGQAVSHGCIRVPNEAIEQLEQLLPLGTPVVVA